MAEETEETTHLTHGLLYPDLLPQVLLQHPRRRPHLQLQPHRLALPGRGLGG